MSSRRLPDLELQAREFAGEISAALNGTVTDGVRLSVFKRLCGAIRLKPLRVSGARAGV